MSHSQARDSVAFRNRGNMLSVLSWVAVYTAETYSASKAAAWALTPKKNHTTIRIHTD